MGDEVTCKCVLGRYTTGGEYLMLVCSPDFHFRIIPLRPKGDGRTQTPEWEYEERDGRLHLTPSLLCTDTGFHTGYNWSADFERAADGVDCMERFYELNPDIRRRHDEEDDALRRAREC
jgi:hypothetical protein